MAMKKGAEAQESRRGRPRAGERAARRQKVLDAALAELVEHGYDRLTTEAIARRAGSSKQTIYRWFGNREGLITAMIEVAADRSSARVVAALEADLDPGETLTIYARGLLTLLTSDQSVELNRAAMSSPDLARSLLDSGRHRVGPIIEEYLAQLHDEGLITVDSTADAFSLLYGLIVQDTQIRVLLGDDGLTSTQIEARATAAVAAFMELTRKSSEMTTPGD